MACKTEGLGCGLRIGACNKVISCDDRYGRVKFGGEVDSMDESSICKDLKVGVM